MINALVNFQPNAVFAATTLAFGAAIPPTLVAQRIDRRQLSGDGVWSKPAKFAVSLAVHFATFALITGWMPLAAQQAILLRLVAWFGVAAGLFELGYISLQAARGRHSHFNRATRAEAVLSLLMGVGAVIVLMPALVIGLQMMTGPLAEWSLSVRVGVAIGLLGGAGLTLLTGMAMGAARSRFAVPPRGVPRKMRLTGWSLNSADLRPAHFLAAHMMQVVPIVAVLAARWMPGPAAVTVTVLFGCGWGAVTWKAYRSAKIS